MLQPESHPPSVALVTLGCTPSGVDSTELAGRLPVGDQSLVEQARWLTPIRLADNLAGADGIRVMVAEPVRAGVIGSEGLDSLAVSI